MLDPDRDYYAAGLLPGHFMLLADQLVDSEIESTRVYWRRKLGLSEDIINDPRPLAEIE